MSIPQQPEDRQARSWYENRRVGLGVPRDLPISRLAVKRFPYHVVYRETVGAIRVAAIAHDRRKPG